MSVTQAPPVLIPKQLTSIPGGREYFVKQKDSLYQLWTKRDKITEFTPASATADGVKGTLAHDDNYIYYCSDTNTWLRVAIGNLFSTW